MLKRIRWVLFFIKYNKFDFLIFQTQFQTRMYGTTILWTSLSLFLTFHSSSNTNLAWCHFPLFFCLSGKHLRKCLCHWMKNTIFHFSIHRYIIPYFYIAEFLSEFGYSEEHSAYLISVIGIFNTVGMIALGWVGDQKWCNVSKTYAVCLLCKY